MKWQSEKERKNRERKNHEGAIRGLPLERGPFLANFYPAGATPLATGFTLGPKKFLVEAPLPQTLANSRSRSRLARLALLHQRHLA